MRDLNKKLGNSLALSLGNTIKNDLRFYLKEWISS